MPHKVNGLDYQRNGHKYKQSKKKVKTSVFAANTGENQYNGTQSNTGAKKYGKGGLGGSKKGRVPKI